MTKAELRQIVDNNTTRKGKIFDYCIEILIFLSLLGYALETLPNNPPQFKLILRWIEIVAVIFFTFEYLLRI